MKEAMQLKAIIKNIAKEKNISAQLVMQNFMLERLLERISVSKYQSHFILKGGFLIASMIGLDARATMDMDATIKSLPMSEEFIAQMFIDIGKVKLNDGISFALGKIDTIRDSDEYSGYRISLTAHYPPMAIPLKLDITTGDRITPKEIIYEFKLLLENRSIQILAYNLETILAEKLETIITRGDQNTRPRDYYDVFILHKLQEKNIHYGSLKLALSATAEKRNSSGIIKNYKTILDVVTHSDTMQKYWLSYQKNFDYAHDIGFADTCDAVREIMGLIVEG